MRISVRSRTGRKGKEPWSFCLGRRELYVTDILERCELTGACRFQVRVTDGRRFVIRHQPPVRLSSDSRIRTMTKFAEAATRWRGRTGCPEFEAGGPP